MADINKMSRQRLDFRKGPNGEEVAVLTVTLGDKSVHRFEDSATDTEVNAFARGLANAEMKQKEIAGEIAGLSDDEIAGMFGKIFKAVKKVGKVARKIATSKVFRKASQGLVAISPALGPFGPAAAAVGGGMMVASKLADASIAAESGAKGISRALSGGAKKYASKITRGRRGRRGAWGQLMRWGNSKRKSALARAGGRRSWQRYRQQRRRPRYAPQRFAPQRFQRFAPQRFRPAPQWQQYARQARQMIPRWAY